LTWLVGGCVAGLGGGGCPALGLEMVGWLGGVAGLDPWRGCLLPAPGVWLWWPGLAGCGVVVGCPGGVGPGGVVLPPGVVLWRGARVVCGWGGGAVLGPKLWVVRFGWGGVP
jgi:hypothetical protein